MKLHIGGMEKKEGWKILNIQKNDGKEKNVDFVGDISDLSQFDDGSIEEVYASHTLEHVNQKNIRKTIEGIYRVLKDNGKFYVSVPDMDMLCKIFLDPKPPVGIKYEVMRMIFGGQTDEFDFHYFGWNMSFIEYFFTEAGFKKIERVKSFSLFKDTSEFLFYGVPISLNVIAYK
jgi:predicted SAM-dependent methyltransferase